MLRLTEDLTKAHIAALHAQAEHDRRVASAIRAGDRRQGVPRAPAGWWRRLMGMPAPALGSRPLVDAT